MNIKNIKEIVNDEMLTDNQKRHMLYLELAHDENAITTILGILDAERQEKRELILDLNLYLSKAHMGLETPKLNKDGFMQKEIRKFYKSGRINHCFKIDDDAT